MTPASHVGQLLDHSPEMASAVAKAAECTVPLLLRAVTEPELLSGIQWALIAHSAEVPASWLGSGEAWHADMCLALQRNTRSKPTSLELQRVRRKNLGRLADACFQVATLAALLNTSATMLSDLKNSETRTFGERRARTMETGLGLPDGWFDRDEPVPADLAERALQLTQSRKIRAEVARSPQKTGSQLRQAANGLPALEGLAPIHQAVLTKYLDLAHAGRLDEPFAYGLLGTLLEAERAPAPSSA